LKSKNYIKPLSATKYYINNLKKSLLISSSIGFSILLIIIIQQMLYSQNIASKLASYEHLKIMTIKYNEKTENFNQNKYSNIKNIDSVEKVVDADIMYAGYNNMVGNMNVNIYSINKENLKYFIDKLDISIVDGRLPESTGNEIVIDEYLLRNTGKKIGDYIGREVDKNERFPGKYKIVGVLDKKLLIGIVLKDGYGKDNNGKLFFPKKDQLNSMNSEILKEYSSEGKINTIGFAAKRMDNNNKEFNLISSIIIMILVFILAFTSGSSSYAHYYSRRNHFGILKGIGYTKNKIVRIVTKEILLDNFIGLIIGIIVSILFMYILQMIFFKPGGIHFKALHINSNIKIFIIPLSTFIFSCISAWWIIMKINTIELIEKFE
jgi:ABC-type lipoprotein release transport system permease subunit